ncbi:serine/threonine protein phosphatase [Rubidibacter lacunae KORDI 51-2]|uniref:Serine/threonine protein phosphatase n=1 Tax=Rubidibacter lacunae KORDI 51-2 TaxID=582515 RepID=U5DLG1_9CHRO|nr:serine/threonine phosphatase [Rubidibacter lacunae]ERN41414.1 serine/threonine protein phosphatase [Rubidibacter lacunae KORDI 51-2]
MLICPQCQFENALNAEICQSCGTSLTHAPCPDCGADVARRDLICSNCGAQTGTTLLAILTPLTPRFEDALGPSTLPMRSLKFAGTFASGASYLDTKQRYRLLGTPPAEVGPARARVLDEQPLQRTGLDILGSQCLGNSREVFQTHVAPYLQLAKHLMPSIPAIREAWQSGDRVAVLVNDRSDWSMLSEIWVRDRPPLMELLWWLAAMGKLWQPLGEVGCQQSLLVAENLRLDEDRVLCLCQLYPDPPRTRLSLQDLGRLWQGFHARCNRLEKPLLAQLCDDLAGGAIATVEQLQQSLQSLAMQAGNVSAGDARVPFASDDGWDGSDVKTAALTGSEDVPTVALPLQVLALSDAGCTDIGRRREHNEDFFGMESLWERHETPLQGSARARGLYIVCDGMGGHAAGEVASRMAVESLLEYFHDRWHDRLPDEDTVCEGILTANEKIFAINQAQSSSGLARMGTTLVLALVQDTQVAIAHVGDSRIYRVTRKHGLEQLSVDHEVGQRDIRRGVDPELAYNRPDAFQLTQALGPRESNSISPEIQTLDVTEDTLLLLCSDGLSDRNLLELHADDYLVPLLGSKADIRQGLQALVDFANEYNGHDNITAILVRLKVRPQVHS